ncbi:MAG: hypothetical protein IID42_09015 [Planctomycetes bacterium]|nr:hypothetical protein [Planctomycetota bacterium]
MILPVRRFKTRDPTPFRAKNRFGARRGKDGFVFLGMKGRIMGQFMWFLFVAAVFFGVIFGFVIEPAST